jgi:ABC-2 type transport system ATP-binding protein
VGRFHPQWDPALADRLRTQMKLDADRKVGVLSKGQSSRLALLLALAHRPRIVILDDPTLGLDPIARRDFLRDVIGYLQAEGVTVFFSSHLLYEIEPICDHVAILHEGRILKCSAVDELRESVKRVMLKEPPAVDIHTVPGLLDVQQHEGRLLLTVERAVEARAMLQTAGSNGLAMVDLNLDEIFEAYVIGRREVSHVAS